VSAESCQSDCVHEIAIESCVVDGLCFLGKSDHNLIMVKVHRCLVDCIEPFCTTEEPKNFWGIKYQLIELYNIGEEPERDVDLGHEISNNSLTPDWVRIEGNEI